MTASAVADDWEPPNVDRGQAIAMGLFVAEWSAGGDDFFRAYGRTQDEAVENVLAQRDKQSLLQVSTENRDRRGGAIWIKL